ncbi:MAG TPA: DPP IV N-terminal domain-containing protein [Vicinamibacterales bacterium]|nr:DPP IV N-terminal domain-containing protein [Vicinamibacterales bacterium]
MRRALRALVIVVIAAVAAVAAPAGRAQVLDRASDVPGADAYARLQQRLREAPPFVTGALSVQWAADSGSFSYVRDRQRHRFDIATARDAIVDGPLASGPAPSGVEPVAPPVAVSPCPPAAVARGRQRACEPSPDHTRRAFYRDRNVYLSDAGGRREVAVTHDGDERTRIKNGIASWVYGEELDQTTAMWWSPDGRKLAFYRFDESRVKDYYLTLDQTRVQSRIDVEAYPKAGTDNPIADVRVYDLDTHETMTLDVRDGKPFRDEVVGYYVYGIDWAPDSRSIRLFRTDRLQRHLEYVACPLSSSPCRVIVREASTTGWVENRPLIRSLSDNRRFILGSDRTGWRNYFLADYETGAIAPITRLTSAEAGPIIRVDEQAGVLFYMARDGDSFLKWQLHRVGLDGRDDVRLTDPRFTHSVSLAPDGRHFVDVYQTHADAPASRLVDDRGRVVAELVTSDVSRMTQLGLKPVEQFSYLAADGRTRLFGTIAFPSTFDPSRRYPVLLRVYGGPESDSEVPTETFVMPSPTTEYGFLVLSLGTRAQPGLGRGVLDSIYLKLGQTEVDDLAAGVRAIASRPYVDAARVGIYGTSYGGYASLMALLRYPGVFAAASASSAPVDWRLYDTIYTERYMSTPDANAAGYDAGSALTHVGDLRGALLVYFGTADNNVHPSNALQLIQACARAGKSIDVQVGADLEHSSVPFARMMQFFVERLALAPERAQAEREVARRFP